MITIFQESQPDTECHGFRHSDHQVAKDPFDGLHSLVQIGFRKDEHELVTPVAVSAVDPKADRGLDDAGDVRKGFISPKMSIGVVEGLEVIQIEKGYGEILGGPGCAPDLSAQILVQEPLVIESGYMIGP